MHAKTTQGGKGKSALTAFMISSLFQIPELDPDLGDKDGLTPFLHAVLGGSLDCVKALAQLGNVDTDTKDKKGRNAVIVAASKGHLNVLKVREASLPMNH